MTRRSGHDGGRGGCGVRGVGARGNGGADPSGSVWYTSGYGTAPLFGTVSHCSGGVCLCTHCSGGGGVCLCTPTVVVVVTLVPTVVVVAVLPTVVVVAVLPL